MSDTRSSGNHWTCPNCGTSNAGTTRLCYACGTADPDHVEPKPRGWISALSWFGIGLVLFVVAMIALMRAIGIL